MSDLSGSELRKAVCEILGMELKAFRIFYIGSEMPARDRFFYSTEEAQQYIDAVDEREPPQHKSHGKVEIRSCDRDLPAIESDPAVSEPLFLEWCEKNAISSELRVITNGDGHRKITIKLWPWRVPHGRARMRIDIEGLTPSEARARAILAASRIGMLNPTTPSTPE